MHKKGGIGKVIIDPHIHECTQNNPETKLLAFILMCHYMYFSKVVTAYVKLLHLKIPIISVS